jgi:membrane protein YdbS with pleckstrin-like domain
MERDVDLSPEANPSQPRPTRLESTGHHPAPRMAATGALFPNLPVTLQPDPSLLRYYLLSSLLLGPFFPLALVPLYFRYRTLRYELDEEGITMRWGILFRREISLTYARIQDIHLSSNVVERWLGLAKVQVQTASGSAAAEMTIEGLRIVESLRDFLYSRMRGARDHHEPARRTETELNGPDQDLATTLRAIAEDMRAIREAIAPSTRGRE